MKPPAPSTSATTRAARPLFVPPAGAFAVGGVVDARVRDALEEALRIRSGWIQTLEAAKREAAATGRAHAYRRARAVIARMRAWRARVVPEFEAAARELALALAERARSERPDGDGWVTLGRALAAIRGGPTDISRANEASPADIPACTPVVEITLAALPPGAPGAPTAPGRAPPPTVTLHLSPGEAAQLASALAWLAIEGLGVVLVADPGLADQEALVTWDGGTVDLRGGAVAERWVRQ